MLLCVLRERDDALHTAQAEAERRRPHARVPRLAAAQAVGPLLQRRATRWPGAAHWAREARPLLDTCRTPPPLM